MSNSKFDRMVKTLPSLYKPTVNTYIRGLLKAWALGDDDATTQISNAKSQLFIAEAEGRYLDYLGNNLGVDRDPGLGIGDSDFRNLIPVLSYYPKQVRRTIISLLDVFWGPGFTRPNINSGNTETFDFGPASVLSGTMTFTKGNRVVVGTGTNFLVSLQPGDYIKPVGADGTAYQKISAVLSNTQVELTDVWASDIAVNVSAAKGVIRELSYIADSGELRTIRFKPYAFSNLSAVTVDELIAYINTNTKHTPYITASKFLDPQTGNKLNIRTNTPGLLGSIQIIGGDANAPSRLNFTTEKRTEVRASVYELNPNEVVIQIPSSVPVLRRTLKGAIHPKNPKTELYSVNEVYNFSVLGASSTLNITVDGTPYVVTFTHASDFQDPTAATSLEVATVINEQLNFLEALEHSIGGYRKVGLRTTEGSQEYQVTGGTANTVLQFDTTLQQDPDIIIPEYPAAYVFDGINQLFTVTGATTELSTTVLSGSITPTISVDDASSFPNQPGKIIFDFGRAEQEGPINYNSRPNNSTLLIDASYVFQKEHVAGRRVNLVIDQATTPRVTGDDYPVYIVGTEDARSAAQNLIRRLIAAGVVIRFLINFPEVLFECVCKDCGPPLSPDYQGSLTGQGPLVF